MTGWIITLVTGLVFLLLSYALSDSLATVFFSIFYLIGIVGSIVGAAGILITLVVRIAN